ncbi:MAG: S8 family peptidase [Lewinellaceae bacterium]|nr:S8 family peptidase [Lewinella sp.]MCB9281470.1 S8 family peptidase [Lewinellaceae bacterium]
MKSSIFFLFGFLIAGNSVTSQSANNPHTLVFKVNPEFRSVCMDTRIELQELNKALLKLGKTELRKKFPNGNRVKNPVNDLSLIYGLHYEADCSPETACRILQNSGVLVYAEPTPVLKAAYVPDDPEIAKQYALELIKAFEGWEIEQGDSSVVIGIVDSGVEWTHPDLQSNIAYNWADPIDGIDNDNDGYIDNFRGWDFFYQDNDPMTAGNDHGTWVTGLCSAATDNHTGIAGVGFKCRFLPVRVSGDGSNNMTFGYDGIVYAADKGCRIINCSWGGVTEGGLYAQDIVNYATFERNALIVAASGNQGENQTIFPAGFDQVISCAATDQNDLKTGFSNWGPAIDLCAPGIAVHTTDAGGEYNGFWGTSFATPIISGCAALVRARFPQLTPEQTAERLRRTADLIDTLPGNQPFSGFLGGGRVNLYRALSETDVHAVRSKFKILPFHGQDGLQPGDTANLAGYLVNYLDSVSGLIVSLSTSSPDIDLINPDLIIGGLTTLDTFFLNGNEFKIRVHPDAARGQTVLIKVSYSGDNYEDFEWIYLTVNSGYINVNVNRLKAGFGSAGRTGFNRDYHLDGNGYIFEDKGLVYFSGIGLMIGGSQVRVSDAFYDNGSTSQDFKPIEYIKEDSSSQISDKDLITRFDDKSISGGMNLEVTLKTHSWSDVGFDNFHILDYSVRNAGALNAPPLYIGLGADWDLDSNLKGSTDTVLNLGYVWSTQFDSLYAGIAVLTENAAFRHYAIDYLGGDDENFGGINIFDQAGFSTSDKYQSLKNQRPEGGTLSNNGNGIVSVVSSGPFFLMPGDSANVVFAVIAGKSLEELQIGAQRAKDRFNGYLVSSLEPYYQHLQMELFPNPGRNFSALLKISDPGLYSMDIYNLNGSLVWSQSRNLDQGAHTFYWPESETLPSGIYVARVRKNGFRSIVKKWIKY